MWPRYHITKAVGEYADAKSSIDVDCYCSTAADIVELWKAGDFFGISEIRLEAVKAMSRRLSASTEFLQPNPKPKTSPRANKSCNTITAVHEVCGHFSRESRVCPVSSLQGNDVFRVCEPHVLDHRPSWCDLCGGFCASCVKLLEDARLFYAVVDQFRQAAEERSRENAPRPLPTPPKDETRESVESEIQDLCEALNMVLADTPKGSRIHTQLLDHMCETTVESWGGVEVCRFLERQYPVA